MKNLCPDDREDAVEKFIDGKIEQRAEESRSAKVGKSVSRDCCCVSVSIRRRVVTDRGHSVIAFESRARGISIFNVCAMARDTRF